MVGVTFEETDFEAILAGKGPEGVAGCGEGGKDAAGKGDGGDSKGACAEKKQDGAAHSGADGNRQPQGKAPRHGRGPNR